MKTMAEISAVGLVDEDKIMVGPNGEKRVTLKHEFNWFLSPEFAELSKDFKPVDDSKYLKDKNMDQCKEKSPPHTSCENDDTSKENVPPTITNSLTSKSNDFWRIYDEVEREQASNPGSTMDVDKNTVGGEDLRSRLLSSNRFYQSDAAMIIQDMVKAGYLEEVSFETYRKKKQWLNDNEDNRKKEK
ncbi:MAG: hypothetical protein WA667_07135 [Candidatus Nitrosopolaris sp.]